MNHNSITKIACFVGITSILAVAIFALTFVMPEEHSIAVAQGTIISVSPFKVYDLEPHYLNDRLICRARNNNNEDYLVHFSLTSEIITNTLNTTPFYVNSGVEWAYLSPNGRYMYICTSDPSGPVYWGSPGTISRYDIADLSSPVLAGQLYKPDKAYGIGILSDPTKLTVLIGVERPATPAIVTFPAGQILGTYDNSSGISRKVERPGGGFIALAHRRKYLDDQDAVEPPETLDRDWRSLSRSGLDLIELTPNLQYVRSIGLNNMFEGMIGMTRSEKMQLDLGGNGLWAVISRMGKSNYKPVGADRYSSPTHPHDKWFDGLIVIDIASGNIVRHWYPGGGGLDGKVNWFDITADGMKVVAKSGAEEWGAMGEPITNGYVYIFNLGTGQFVKQDWGLEDGSDIEIVDSVNRVYCTLPSQQALVWFPMP